MVVPEPQIFDALDHDRPAARGGRLGGRGVRVPGLLGAVVAVGLRALTRRTHADRGPVAAAEAGAVRGVQEHACALTLVGGSASARQRTGDRRGTASGRRGDRHRPIAQHVRRPQGTVRGWLRAARTRAESLRACATQRLAALDPEPAAVTATATSLGDAVEAIMLAVRAWALRFGKDSVGPWERAVWLTDGLLHGCPPLPP